MPADGRARSLKRALLPALTAAVALAASFATAPIASAAPSALSVSMQPDRSARQTLAGRTLSSSAKIYVFATSVKSIYRVRFYLDDAAMSRLPRFVDTTAPYDFNGTAADGTAVAFDLSTLSAASHTITAAMDRTTGGPQVVSATFTVTAPPPPAPAPAPAPSPSPSPSPSPTAFPSRLRASGRSIVDESGNAVPTMRGFNMHVGPGFTWSQSNFNDIAALGAKINRAVIHWDQFEPSQGIVDGTAISNLDLHIARAEAAGLYTLLELHLNVGRDPSWTSAKSTEMEKYGAYGQTLTQYLAYRYGNPASPRYTKAVVGFGLNEPPLEDSTIRNGSSSIPYLEGKQRQMISWLRAPGYAPDWIGFVAYGYASATPIYDHTWQNSNAVDASPTAYASVGGNVVIDVHDYVIGCTNTTPTCDGRQWNGMSYPTYQGGPQIGTGDSPAPGYSSSAYRRSQQAAFLAPYKTFSQNAAIPLMVGEWGWQPASSGELAWIADKELAWANAGAAIQIQWNYDITTNTSVNFWAARPGNVWMSSVSHWMASPST